MEGVHTYVHDAITGLVNSCFLISSLIYTSLNTRQCRCFSILRDVTTMTD